MPTAMPLPLEFQNESRAIVLLGGLGDTDAEQFGSTEYAKVILDQLWGIPPKLDMAHEKRVHDAMRAIVAAGLAESAHDLSDGGLGVALAKASFQVGADIQLDSPLSPEHLLFHEGPSRIVLSTSTPEEIHRIATEHRVACATIGATMKMRLQIRNRDQVLIQVNTSELLQRFESAFPQLLKTTHV